jgi:hypothetical protein
MGLHRLCLVFAVPLVVMLAACGDNGHPVFQDAGDDGRGSGSDASIDAPDVRIERSDVRRSVREPADQSQPLRHVR